MAGTKSGGYKTAITTKQRYGESYYVEIGRLGGQAGTGLKGFAKNRQLAAMAGRKGGQATLETTNRIIWRKNDGRLNRAEV